MLKMIFRFGRFTTTFKEPEFSLQKTKPLQPMSTNSNTQSLVLIVDDTPRNLQVLGGLLKDDYRISLAASGERAVEMVSKNPPDLILLDVMMPGMDGFQTCAALKQIPIAKDIPIIFLTARTQTDDIVKGFESGAVDYITKPFNALELKVRIRNHLDLRQKTLVLQSLCERDGLTTIPNRRRFDQFLDIEWRRCMRRQLFLSLLMIDIDFFKNFNDRYGHLAGDECLKQAANAIAGTVNRPGDLAARYGGEEFAVILADTDRSNAHRIAGYIADAVRSLNIAHQASPISEQVTISIGVSTVIPERKHSPEELIDSADRALYQAKEAGRNRIQVHAPEITE